MAGPSAVKGFAASSRPRIVTIVPLDRNSLRGLDRRAQQAPGAAAQVEDQSLHPPALEALDRRPQLGGRVGPELADLGITDRVIRVEEGVPTVVADAEAADAPDRHDAPRDGQVLRAAVGVLHLEPHHLARLAEDSLDHLGELEPPGRLDRRPPR